MGLREDMEAVQKELNEVKQEKNNLEKDSNSVYLLTREKNNYFIILIIIFIMFVSFLLFSFFYIYGKINFISSEVNSINSKIDSMINAEDEYYDYERNIEVDSGDGENANYVNGNNNSINN